VTTPQPLESSTASSTWRAWIALGVIVMAAAYLVIHAITGWKLLPVDHLYVSWAVGAAFLVWWWLVTGASASAVASWLLLYLFALLAGLALAPPRWAGVPSAIFYGIWTVVTVWDPARRIWQRVNAWATWPLFVAVMPSDERDRYRRYREVAQIPSQAYKRADTRQRVSLLRATADRVRLLDAPSEPWLEMQRWTAASYDRTAELLESGLRGDGQPALDAIAQRDAAWEQVLYRLSPWGWRLLMWGPSRRVPPGPQPTAWNGS
jgi:hypothetical protein